VRGWAAVDAEASGGAAVAVAVVVGGVARWGLW